MESNFKLKFCGYNFNLIIFAVLLTFEKQKYIFDFLKSGMVNLTKGLETYIFKDPFIIAFIILMLLAFISLYYFAKT